MPLARLEQIPRAAEMYAAHPVKIRDWGFQGLGILD